jgi:5-methylcytosine-specific restriction endonuclease McrA
MKIKAALKNQVKHRAKGCCEYCWSQHEFSPDSFVIEHIIPSSKGGTSVAENLAYIVKVVTTTNTIILNR